MVYTFKTDAIERHVEISVESCFRLTFGDVTEKLSEYLTLMVLVALPMLTTMPKMSGTTLFPQLRMFSKCFKLNRTFYCQLKLNKLKHIPHVNIKILLKNSFQNMFFVNLTEEQCDLLTSLWRPFPIITPNQTNFNKHGLVEYYF